MDTTTTMYTLPNCVQCAMTKRALDASGIEYDVVDLTKDDEAREAVRERGFTTAPIVTVEPAGLAWSGFQPDRIADLSLELEQQEVATCSSNSSPKSKPRARSGSQSTSCAPARRRRRTRPLRAQRPRRPLRPRGRHRLGQAVEPEGTVTMTASAIQQRFHDQLDETLTTIHYLGVMLELADGGDDA